MAVARQSFGDSKQRWGRGARLADTVNICELLINLVTIEKPKLLLGFNQKVHGRLIRLTIGSRRQGTIGGKAEPKSVV